MRELGRRRRWGAALLALLLCTFPAQAWAQVSDDDVERYVSAVEALASAVEQHWESCPRLAKEIATVAAERGAELGGIDEQLGRLPDDERAALMERYGARLDAAAEALAGLGPCLEEEAVLAALSSLGAGAVDWGVQVAPEKGELLVENWFRLVGEMSDLVQTHRGKCSRMAGALAEFVDGERGERLQALTTMINALPQDALEALYAKHAGRMEALGASLEPAKACRDEAAVAKALRAIQ